MAAPERQLSNFRYRHGLRLGTPAPAPGFAPGPYNTWRTRSMGQGQFGVSTGYNELLQTLQGTLVSGAAAFYNPGVYVVVVQAITSEVNPTVTFDAPSVWAAGIGQLANGVTCKTGNKGPGLTGVFNKQVTISSLNLGAGTCVLNGITTAGQTYAPIGTPGSLDPQKNFTFTINVAGDYTGLVLDQTTIGSVFPFVNGRYQIANVLTNLLQIDASTAGSRLPIAVNNVKVLNQNPNADVQLVNPLTGNVLFKNCDVWLNDLVVEHGAGGINTYSLPLAGGGSSDGGVIVPQGATIVLADSTGFFNGYNLRQCAYDGYKVNGNMQSFSFAHGTHHRHDALLGGGHTDGFQITALDNSLLTGPTFYYIWMEAGGHSCIYWNDYQGDNIHKIRNNMADSCMFYKGNNGATFSHGRLCGVRNSWFPDNTGGDGNPGVLPMLFADAGSSDPTHGDHEFPIFYNNYSMKNDGSQLLLPNITKYSAWRSGQVLGAFPL